MAKGPPETILKILNDYDLDSSSIWEVRAGSGNYAIYHKAIERIQAKVGVVFDPPVIIHDGHNAKNEIVVCVTGRIGERTEWSFGECTPNNTKNLYPWAMAEKRAKDRVVLKLINAHGDLYSEDESDDFKRSSPDYNAKTGKRTSASLKRDTDDNGFDPYNLLIRKLDEIAERGSSHAVEDYWQRQDLQAKLADWPQAWRDEAQGYYETIIENMLENA